DRQRLLMLIRELNLLLPKIEILKYANIREQILWSEAFDADAQIKSIAYLLKDLFHIVCREVCETGMSNHLGRQADRSNTCGASLRNHNAIWLEQVSCIIQNTGHPFSTSNCSHNFRD